MQVVIGVKRVRIQKLLPIATNVVYNILVYLHMFTIVQLDSFIKGWVVCGLPVIRANSKRGESSRSRASNSGRSLNRWASMAPNRCDIAWR
jgi:hypothetical protein